MRILKFILLIITFSLAPLSFSAPNIHNTFFDLFIGEDLKFEDAIYISYEPTGHRFHIRPIYNPYPSTRLVETAVDDQQREEFYRFLLTTYELTGHRYPANSIYIYNSQPPTHFTGTPIDIQQRVELYSFMLFQAILSTLYTIMGTETASENPFHLTPNTNAGLIPSTPDLVFYNWTSIFDANNWRDIFLDAIGRALSKEDTDQYFVLLRSGPVFNYLLNSPDVTTSSDANQDTEDTKNKQRVVLHYSRMELGTTTPSMQNTGLRDYIRVVYQSINDSNSYNLSILVKDAFATHEYQVHAVFMSSKNRKLSLRSKQFRKDYHEKDNTDDASGASSSMVANFFTLSQPEFHPQTFKVQETTPKLNGINIGIKLLLLLLQSKITNGNKFPHT